jgi:NADH-quinone oxidoreductase subunit H
VALAGWSSNSKYALLGSLRSSAQMVSYELALTLSVVGVLLLAGTLSLRELVHAQEAGWFILPQLIGFVCFFISGVAETNRSPFDLPEAETELVAGFHTEYSSMKFAMFFMAEYAHIFTTSFLATILFFGGWLSPFPQSWYGTTQYLPVGAALLLAAAFAAGALKLPRPLHRALSGLLCLALLGVAVLLAGVPPLLGFVQGLFWFITKTVAFLFVFIWVRATLPRFRYDQLMAFGWKFLVPLATLNIVVTSFVIAWRVG